MKVNRKLNKRTRILEIHRKLSARENKVSMSEEALERQKKHVRGIFDGMWERYGNAMKLVTSMYFSLPAECRNDRIDCHDVESQLKHVHEYLDKLDVQVSEANDMLNSNPRNLSILQRDMKIAEMQKTIDSLRIEVLHCKNR